ncbi:HD-GYP domain-containing protein [bacterium]|nr:HD-GYP domain-containing protein [bacterium]
MGGEFTAAHSARVLDLAMDLADEIGLDEQTRRDVEGGIAYKDLGEMALLLDQESDEKMDQVAHWMSGQDLQQAGILHDIGKTRIPPEILYKPGKLSEEEYELMKLHPVLGEQMIQPIESLRHLCPVIRGHHERWDGKGYPDGLRGEQIPLGARIIAVADVFDALHAERPYKAALPVERVRSILMEGRGTHFDPALADAFGRVLERRFPELGNPFA